MNTLTDEELMKEAQAGNQAAFSDLIFRYERPLYGYLMRLLRNDEAARDAFQDTWFRVLKALHRFDSELKFAPWMYRIATNLCRDQMRRGKLRRHPSLDQPVGADEEAVFADFVADPGQLPDENAGSSDLGEHVRRAVETLPPRQQEAFVLRHYQGLTYEEIARAQKCSLTAVKSNIHHAVVALRKQLDRLGLSPVTQS